ncbi:MAG: hypothetical protein WA220_11745, partial [Candidatus Nitrosopolaris sp.]
LVITWSLGLQNSWSKTEPASPRMLAHHFPLRHLRTVKLRDQLVSHVRGSRDFRTVSCASQKCVLLNFEDDVIQLDHF